jgi:hypothetical protein
VVTTHDTGVALGQTAAVQASDPPALDGPSRTLTLEFDSDGDPIRGRVREGTGSEHEFVGWLGLAKALELALGAGGPPRLNGAPKPAG